MEQEKVYYSFEDIKPTDIMHYGTPRHSGRYPWGSGAKYHQKRTDFLTRKKMLENEGYKESDIAKMLGCRNIDHLRAKVERYDAEIELHEITMCEKLKEKGWSNVAIAQRLGVSEGTVRNHLKRSASGKIKMEAVMKLQNVLTEEMERQGGYLDVGKDSNLYLDVSPDRLKKALEHLKDRGYHVRTFSIPQQGRTGQNTTLKVLCPPDTTWKDMWEHRFEIGNLANSQLTLDDNGKGDIIRLRPPTQLDGKRIFVRYAEDGGTDRDGMIELRRGVEDLDMGNSKYAQVRIAVDGKSYIKGMAVYSDNIPEGYDIIVNSNKKRGTDFYNGVLKKQNTEDPLNPFGTAIKAGGQRGALNIVREEGEWSDWSRTLPSQFLSKQPLELARTQLTLTKDIKRQQFEDIMAIKNPTLRKRMLVEFGDECDADAVALKAAAMPRQATQVILPIPSLKENECYAPQFDNGTVLSLVRFPHGGKFEIPEVIVNNGNKEARGIIENAIDAIGIHPKTAQILSGADFDGDTVLAIPNNDRRVKNQAPLEGLKNFDTGEYKVPEGCKPMRKGWKKGSTREGTKMGEATNLITDMTLQGATEDELERATKFSMVVIDTGKHGLDWYRCYQDCGIKALQDKYQGHYNENGRWSYGARTLISKAKSETSVEKHSDAYTILETGEKEYHPKKDRYGNVLTGTQKDTKMGAAKDARELLNPDSSEMEKLYAEYANAMKALGNESRKASLSVQENKVSKEATTKYKDAVASLDAKLIEAKKNAPLERQAHLIAGSLVKIAVESNPDMSKGELAKVRGKSIVQARQMNGANKKRIVFTDEEWEAMENGAVSKSKMNEIFNNANQDSMMEHAFPKANTVMTNSRITLANSMLKSGHTIADVAEHFGVSPKTLTDAIRKEGGSE